MAEEKPVAGDETEGTPPKKKSKMGALFVLALTGAGGYFAGTSVLAPRLLADGEPAAQDDHAAEPEPEDDGHGAPADDGHGAPASDGHGPPANDGHGAPAGDGHGGPPPEDEGHFMEIGNLLVNPSDSKGLRFLMITIALELEDSDTRALLRQREAQVRDIVISVLEPMTMDQLSAPGVRDSIRVGVRQAVIDQFHMPFLNVFISQFVLN